MKTARYISTLLVLLIWAQIIHSRQLSPQIDSLGKLLLKKTGRERVDLLNELSRAYWNHSYIIALGHSMEAYQLATSLNYFDGMAESANRIGNVYFFLSDTTRSMEYYRKSLEIAQSVNNQRGIARALNNIGLLYSNLNQFKKANSYFIPSLEILESMSENENLTSILTNLGNSHFRDRDFIGAVKYYERLVRHVEKTGSELALSYALELNGDAYRLIPDREKALEIHKQAYAIREKLSDTLAMAQSIFRIGQILQDGGQLAGAKNHFDTAYELALTTGNLELLADLFEHLSILNEEKGDLKQAFHFQEKYSEMRDSIFSVKSRSRLDELKKIYETEYSENQAELLTREGEIRDYQLRRDASRRNYYIISGLLVLIISVIIISRAVMKQKLNERLRQQLLHLEEANHKLQISEESLQQMNVTKDKFFAIIANDLKNPFSELMNHTEYLSDQLSKLESEEIEGTVAKINVSAKNLFRLLENLLLWSAAQTGNLPYAPENFDLRVFVQKELVIHGRMLSQKNISVSNKIPPGINVYADMELISKVIANLLENSVKYSDPGGHVLISAIKLKNFAEVSISDEGKGMSGDEIDRLFSLDLQEGKSNEKGAGLGLILCKSFIEKHSGIMDAISEKDKGTTFVFTIPVSDRVIG